MTSYREFIENKQHMKHGGGFEPLYKNDMLFDFQKHIVDWSCREGRSAIFADCGLGKTPMQLVWAENVSERTGGNVLILTPLAVSYQTIREGDKFGVEVVRSKEGEVKNNIVVTNYERLQYFHPEDFKAVVCDESSILKSFNGVRRGEITRFMRKVPYRLLCTATAAPNDYSELGTSSEALGYLGYMDMLNRFFRNDRNTSAIGRCYGKKQEWRLKGHAETPFWRWVCSWARALRRPSDIGFDDDGFILKPLYENLHIIEARSKPDDRLFNVEAIDLREQREERKRTIPERCEKAAELVDHDRPALVWCHLNDEGKTLAKMIPDAVEVSGSDNDDDKEAKLLAFANQDVRVLITKPKIGGWGLNFQHCSHVVIFPSHSFEQYYQAVRRCWRFGQKNPVVVDVVASQGEQRILQNLQHKSKLADDMFSRLVHFMREGQVIKSDYNFDEREVMPAWL
jgi:hypothetical protein